MRRRTGHRRLLEPNSSLWIDQMALIAQRVELARNGANDKVFCRMQSGWVVMKPCGATMKFFDSES